MKKQTKKKNKINKNPKQLNFSLKDFLIVLMILSYLLIFYFYWQDIKQYQSVINNPQKLCYIYYSNLNEQISQSDNQSTISRINNTMIHIFDMENEINK